MNNTYNIWGILLFCGVSLLICSCTSYVYVSSYSGGNISSQGLISSLRITIEIILYIIIFSKINRRFLIRTLMLLGYVNSSLVAVEFAERLFHTSGYGTFGTTQILAGFWGYYSEYSRFAGLFNSYASSSYFTCLVISVFMMDSKARADSDIMRLLKMIYLLIPIFFGLRTSVLIVIPFIVYQLLSVGWAYLSLFVSKLRLSIRFSSLIALMVLIINFIGMPRLTSLSNNINKFFGSHLTERIMPAFAFLGGTLEYSSNDTLSYYNNIWIIPTKTFFFGNSQHRYSQFGGNDPLLTRWIYQSGLGSGIIALLFVAALVYYLNQKGCTQESIFLSSTIIAFSIKADTPMAVGFLSLTLASIDIIRYNHHYSKYPKQT